MLGDSLRLRPLLGGVEGAPSDLSDVEGPEDRPQ